MNWSNRSGPEAITKESLEAAMRGLAELGPPPPSEITVSADIYDAVTKAIAPAPDRDPKPGNMSRLRVHMDPLLPKGFWHGGPPRTFEERCRELELQLARSLAGPHR